MRLLTDCSSNLLTKIDQGAFSDVDSADFRFAIGPQSAKTWCANVGIFGERARMHILKKLVDTLSALTTQLTAMQPNWTATVRDDGYDSEGLTAAFKHPMRSKLKAAINNFVGFVREVEGGAWGEVGRGGRLGGQKG